MCLGRPQSDTGGLSWHWACRGWTQKHVPQRWLGIGLEVDLRVSGLVFSRVSCVVL